MRYSCRRSAALSLHNCHISKNPKSTRKHTNPPPPPNSDNHPPNKTQVEPRVLGNADVTPADGESLKPFREVGA